MRIKMLLAILLPFVCIALFAQNSKSRAEFFKEFYGTYLNSTDIEVSTEDKKIPETDLSIVITQMEERYNIDIPASEEAKFTTVEDVAEYVNLYLLSQAEKTKSEPSPQKTSKNYSWKMKIYGSYGIVEPIGVTGNQGWYGNLGKVKRDEGISLFSNTYTWEAGFALHPYGWNGKQKKSPNSWGFSFDYASFDHWGPDTSWAAYPNDTTASRYAISLNFQQDLTGRSKARPRVGFYFMESLRFGVHSYGHFDPDLWGNNHLSYGLGLAQGMYFYIFDLKFYQTIAYSPDILRVRPDLPVLRSLDMEIGLRLGIALKL